MRMLISRPIRIVFLLLAVVAATAVGCGRSETPPPATTAAPAAAEAPKVPAVGLYVTNETSGDLTVIDAGTLAAVATIPLGKRPRGIAASPDGTRVYVALSGSPNAGPGVDEKTLPPPDRTADGIGVVDLQQGKLLKVLTSGPDPEQVAVSSDGTRLFVSNEDAATARIIDASSGQIVESFKVGEEPEGVSVEPSGGRVWVTSEDASAVFVIDLAAHKVVKSVKVGPRPRSVAFLPDGSRAYVPSETGATLTVIDDPSVPSNIQPLDDAATFVSQHYHDFLSREPDPSGFGFWTGQITQCGNDQTCLRNKRIDVSNAFFYELE